MTAVRALGVAVAAMWLAGCGGGSSSAEPDAAPVIVDAVRVDAAPRGGPLVDEAIATCAWAVGCLAEDDGGAVSVGDHLSACLGTFIREHLEPRRFTSRLSNLPYAAYAACSATSPTSCDAFRACLVGEGAMVLCPEATLPLCDGTIAQACDVSRGWGHARDCAAVGLGCDVGRCVGTCEVEGSTCSADGTTIDRCVGGVLERIACAPLGSCVKVGAGEPACLPGELGTCDGPTGFTCEGVQASISCAGGVRQRVDCTTLAQECYEEDGRCGDQLFCNVAHVDTCAGDQLTTCLAGAERAIDCAALGGTCGTLASGAGGCVFP